MGNFFASIKELYNEGWKEEEDFIEKTFKQKELQTKRDIEIKKNKVLNDFTLGCSPDKERCDFCLNKIHRNYKCLRCDRNNINFCERCLVLHQLQHDDDDGLYVKNNKENYIGNNMCI
tara:strand:- start:6 stop:359 length:354 start_codon:yes stop_codon:yes gene_type:complete